MPKRTIMGVPFRQITDRIHHFNVRFRIRLKLTNSAYIGNDSKFWHSIAKLIKFNRGEECGGSVNGKFDQTLKKSPDIRSSFLIILAIVCCVGTFTFPDVPKIGAKSHTRGNKKKHHQTAYKTINSKYYCNNAAITLVLEIVKKFSAWSTDSCGYKTTDKKYLINKTEKKPPFSTFHDRLVPLSGGGGSSDGAPRANPYRNLLMWIHQPLVYEHTSSCGYFRAIHIYQATPPPPNNYIRNSSTNYTRIVGN